MFCSAPCSPVISIYEVLHPLKKKLKLVSRIIIFWWKVSNEFLKQHKNKVIWSKYVCLLLTRQPVVGQGLLIRKVVRSHTTPQSVGNLWTSEQPVAETSTWQHTQHSQQTNFHAPGGIRTHNLGSWAAADFCLRLRGHCDQQSDYYTFFLVRFYNS